MKKKDEVFYQKTSVITYFVGKYIQKLPISYFLSPFFCLFVFIFLFSSHLSSYDLLYIHVFITYSAISYFCVCGFQTSGPEKKYMH